MKKQNKTREGNKCRRSGRLAGKSTAVEDPSTENMTSGEDSDDELYAISDDDEMHADLDDEQLQKYCTEGLEQESDSDSGLSNYQSNDEMSTEHESDSEFEKDLMGACLNRAEFHIPEGEKFKLMQGMMFESVDSFRDVLKEYSILWDFPLMRVKNEKKRVTAVCGDEVCEWRVHASLMPDGITFMIKTCTPDHSCTMKENITAPAKWMGHKIEDLVRADRNVKPEMIRTELLKYGLHPTEMQIFRARRSAQEMNVGDETLNQVFGSSRASSLLGTELCKAVLDKPDRRPRNVRNTKPRAHPKSTANGASLDREPVDWANLDINSAGLGGATNCGIQ